MAEETQVVAEQEQAGQPVTQAEQAESTEQADEAPTWDSWIAKQPEDVQSLYDDHVANLKGALKTERSERETLARQVKALGKSAEAGSELKEQLDKLSEQLSETNHKASFYEAAHGKVTNLAAAWATAKSFGMIDSRTGEVDLDKLQAVVPEFFQVKKLTASANAGNGANPTPTVLSMNDIIRRSAGL